MYDFKKKLKKYSHLDSFYWIFKVINLFAIFLTLLIFIFCHLYFENNFEKNSKIKLHEEVKIGLWVFNSAKNVWVLTNFPLFIIIFCAIVLFFQIILTIILVRHSNYIQIFLLTNFLLIFTSFLVLSRALFFNPNWITNIRQILLTVKDGETKFSFGTLLFIIFVTILFACILICYFFDIFLNLKLQKKVNTYIMNKNYRNQNYKQKLS